MLQPFSKEFRFGSRRVGPDLAPVVIAEMSGNHNQSLRRALKIVEAAANAGADAIKLQTYTPDTMTMNVKRKGFTIRNKFSPWHGKSLYQLYGEAHTPWEWHPPIFRHAQKLGLEVFSSPFDETAVDYLETLKVPAYKIASFEIVDLPLIRYAAKTGKPMIISTGMASPQEIHEALTTAREAGCHEVALLHCISNYPTPIESANLRQIPLLAKRFGTPVGLSDHSLGTTVPVAAVALGACIIEKHLTFRRKDGGPDCLFSSEPSEFQQLCRDVRESSLALGQAVFARPSKEGQSRIFRRSIYYHLDLPVGHRLESSDLRRIRPGFGLPPKFLRKLIGKKLKVKVRRGDPAQWEHVK